MIKTFLNTLYLITGSTVVSFNFANNNVLSNFYFFTLLDHSIPYKPVSYKDYQKVAICKMFVKISTLVNIAFVEVKEINAKVKRHTTINK